MPIPRFYNPMNFTDIPFDHNFAEPVYWMNSELVITIMIILMMCQLFQTPVLIFIYLKIRRGG